MNKVPERTITITNTATYMIPEGSKLNIEGDKVYLNGMLINPSPGRGKEIKMELTGCVMEEFKCERVERIDVNNSSVVHINSVGGRFTINGDVGTDVSVMNSVVTCHSIGGKVNTEGQSPIHVTGPPKPHITPQTHPHMFGRSAPTPEPSDMALRSPTPQLSSCCAPLPAHEGRVTHVSKPELATSSRSTFSLAGASVQELGPAPDRVSKRARLLTTEPPGIKQEAQLPESPPPSSVAVPHPEPILLMTSPRSVPRKRTRTNTGPMMAIVPRRSVPISIKEE